MKWHSQLGPVRFISGLAAVCGACQAARKMVVLGAFCCNPLALSCMGGGYGPPRANTTNTGDLWAFFGGLQVPLVIRDGGPEGRVPKETK